MLVAIDHNVFGWHTIHHLHYSSFSLSPFICHVDREILVSRPFRHTHTPNLPASSHPLAWCHQHHHRRRYHRYQHHHYYVCFYFVILIILTTYLPGYTWAFMFGSHHLTRWAARVGVSFLWRSWLGRFGISVYYVASSCLLLFCFIYTYIYYLCWL